MGSVVVLSASGAVLRHEQSEVSESVIIANVNIKRLIFIIIWLSILFRVKGIHFFSKRCKLTL